MLQNTALKTRTLENECNRVMEKLKNLILHNNVIISAIKSNDKTTAVISMDSFGNKKFVNIDSESLRYADGNREHIKYCELGI